MRVAVPRVVVMMVRVILIVVAVPFTVMVVRMVMRVGVVVVESGGVGMRMAVHEAAMAVRVGVGFAGVRGGVLQGQHPFDCIGRI